jgi:uncharacterized protein
MPASSVCHESAGQIGASLDRNVPIFGALLTRAFAIIFFVFFSAVAAFLLSTVCGGGAGVILIPILSRVLPVSSVPAALSIGTATNSVSRLVAFRRSIRWDLVSRFVPASIPAVWLGAWLLQYCNPMYLELMMGVFLVSNIAQLLGRSEEPKDAVPSKYRLAFIGFAVGFVSGLAGAVGLLFNRFYLTCGMSKEEIIATRATNELLLHVIKLVIYSLYGLMTYRAVSVGSVVAAAAVLAAWSAKWVVSKISTGAFKRIGYSAMVLSGIGLLASAGTTIAAHHKAGIDWMPISNGYEAKLKWANRGLAIEFVWHEGFEIENVVTLADVPAEKREWVESRIRNADSYLIEEVYGLHEHAYELYLEKDGRVEKIDF